MIAQHLPFKRVERRLVGNELPRTTAAVSERMSRVRQHGTHPEASVRRAATALGLHYRTINPDLPGSPDLANRSRKWAIFVHGCYWHHHESCARATTPKTNRQFWLSKFARNRERDASAQRKLSEMGYRVVVLWECESKDLSLLREQLKVLRHLHKNVSKSGWH